MTVELVPAAQYLRMSTDHQQYSLDNQADAIAPYVVRCFICILKSALKPCSAAPAKLLAALREVRSRVD